jgi:hypothetical protein
MLACVQCSGTLQSVDALSYPRMDNNYYNVCFNCTDCLLIAYVCTNIHDFDLLRDCSRDWLVILESSFCPSLHILTHSQQPLCCPRNCNARHPTASTSRLWPGHGDPRTCQLQNKAPPESTVQSRMKQMAIKNGMRLQYIAHAHSKNEQFMSLPSVCQKGWPHITTCLNFMRMTSWSEGTFSR